MFVYVSLSLDIVSLFCKLSCRFSLAFLEDLQAARVLRSALVLVLVKRERKKVNSSVCKQRSKASSLVSLVAFSLVLHPE